MSPQVLFCRSNPIAPDPRVEKEARALAQAGYQVDIVAWDRDGVYPLEETLASAAGQDTGGVSIFRLRVRSKYGHGMQNLPNLLRWQLRLLLWLMAHGRRYQLIHACDFDTIIPALICAFIYRKKIIYDIFDFYADHLRNTPEGLKRAIRKVDLWVIGKVDAVILVDENRKLQIEQAAPRRLAVIYNTPEDAGAPAAAAPGVFSVAYVGLLQMERGLGELVQVFRSHPDWRLNLAGFGGDEPQLRQLIADQANIHWHGRVPYARSLELAREASALIATYDPAIPNHQFSSPNKLFEAMMLGKPLIAARGTGIDAIVEKWEMGLVVTYGEVAELEAALRKLSENYSLITTLGRNARAAHDAYFSWRRMQANLVQLYGEFLPLEQRAKSRPNR